MLDIDSDVRAIGQRLDIALSDRQVVLLGQYIQLLAKWNKAYNLTAIRNIGEMLERHLLDSLSIVNPVRDSMATIHGKRLIDVGTGGGMPGIPLSIIFPDWTFVLLDSNSKKTRFLNQVVIELKLSNVQVVHSRVEGYQPDTLFDGCAESRICLTGRHGGGRAALAASRR